jgi:chromosome partitioning protein
VIIDTPPARSTEAPAAVEFADLVLVPCTPDIEAFEQLPRTARLARTTGKPAIAVLVMAQPNSQTEERVAREVFEAINVPMAGIILHRFKVHRDACREGVTAQEMEPDSKAAQEITALWDWICAELQLSKSARVHEKVET